MNSNDRTKQGGRVLDFANRRAGLPELMICPRCEGQAFDVGSCSLCGSCGYLKDVGGERLLHVEIVQLAATFALAAGLDLAAKDSG